MDAAVRSAALRLPLDGLAGDPIGLRRCVAHGTAVALRTDDAAVVAAALVALDGHAAAVHLLPDGVHIDPTIPVLDSFAIAALQPVGTPPGEPAGTGRAATRWVVYTSGTTGTPKAVTHTVASLSRTVVTTPAAAAHRWGMLYDPNRMAGLQVLLQALATGADLVAPPVHDPLPRRIDALVDAGVSAVSATPTLWRKIVQVPAIARWSTLRQITLGGEIADQHILSALTAAFPQARVVHVFASTETGAAFSVTDGLAGFPRGYLDVPPRGIALQVRDGILHVHAPGVSTAAADGFVSTGDRVELTADRVLFRGRDSGVVNIGGANVWPEEVENLLRDHPDVAEATVTAKSNPMSGNVLIATVVPAPGADTADLAKRVRAWVRQNAPTSHVPAMVKLADSIGMSAAGKISRS